MSNSHYYVICQGVNYKFPSLGLSVTLQQEISSATSQMSVTAVGKLRSLRWQEMYTVQQQNLFRNK